jgi:hypothetical protein
LSALRRSGRFMVIVSRPDSRFCRTVSLLMRWRLLLLVRLSNRHCEQSEAIQDLVQKDGLLRRLRSSQ